MFIRCGTRAEGCSRHPVTWGGPQRRSLTTHIVIGWYRTMRHGNAGIVGHCGNACSASYGLVWLGRSSNPSFSPKPALCRNVRVYETPDFLFDGVTGRMAHHEVINVPHLTRVETDEYAVIIWGTCRVDNRALARLALLP